MLKLRTNLISGIFAVLVGVVILLLIPSQIAKEMFNIQGQISASFMSRLVAIVMICIGIALLFQSLILKQEKIVLLPLNGLFRVGVFFTLLIIYDVLFSLIGFVIPSILVVVGILLLQKCRNYIYYIVCCIFPVMVYFIFNYAFSIRLPLI